MEYVGLLLLFIGYCVRLFFLVCYCSFYSLFIVRALLVITLGSIVTSTETSGQLKHPYFVTSLSSRLSLMVDLVVPLAISRLV